MHPCDSTSARNPFDLFLSPESGQHVPYPRVVSVPRAELFSSRFLPSLHLFQPVLACRATVGITLWLAKHQSPLTHRYHRYHQYLVEDP